jgi:hypothetical protein
MLKNQNLCIVAYLPDTKQAEPQEQPFLSNTRTKNGTTRLCNQLPGNRLVNTLRRRPNDVTLQEYLTIT